MDIRVINSEGWERTWQVEKAIARIGSGAGCDVQLADPAISTMHLQLTKTALVDASCTLRCFSQGVHITRGDQVIECTLHSAYELLDHDEIHLSAFRILVDLNSDSIYRRASKHMEAELEMARNNLSPQTPVSGVLLMKNSGSDHPCQLSMKIEGIPDECIQIGPMPYLFPGGSDSVGFVINHNGIRPEPGVHNLSLILSSPNDYFGEMLIFKFPINAGVEFNNEVNLIDDIDELRQQREDQQVPQIEKKSPPIIPDAEETALTRDNEKLRKELDELKVQQSQWALDKKALSETNDKLLKENECLNAEIAELNTLNRELKENNVKLETETRDSSAESVAENVIIEQPEADAAVKIPPVSEMETTVKRHVPSRPSIPVFGRETRGFFDSEPPQSAHDQTAEGTE